MNKVIFVNSHPIQYFAPLYKYLSAKGLPVEAWYCSDESIKGGIDKQFGVHVKWDVDLLDGYNARFFKNYSWKPSHATGFFGLINLGILKALFFEKKALIIVHGWSYFSTLAVLLVGRLFGHQVCLRCETPQNQELNKTGIKQQIKQFFLKQLVFPGVSYFLYIGKQNQLFYQHFGIPDDKLVFAPYCIDNQRFQEEKQKLTTSVVDLRKEMGIPENATVFIYSGKYISKKRPLDVLEAFNKLSDQNTYLVMIGEGELREPMEQFIDSAEIKSRVILTGFVNQSKMPEYYVVGDIFVLCSELGETWGLVMNEALQFDLTLLCSDTPGSAYDLIVPGRNGYIYETGSVTQLHAYMKKTISELSTTYDDKKKVNEEVRKRFSFQTIYENLDKLVRSL